MHRGSTANSSNWASRLGDECSQGHGAEGRPPRRAGRPSLRNHADGIVAMDLSAGTRSRGAYAPWLAVCIKLNCAYQKPHHCDWGGPPYVSSPSPRAMPKRRNERFGEAEICNACSTQKIPCSDKEFTASAKKFPVPLRREFGCKPLNLPVESTPEITELDPNPRNCLLLSRPSSQTFVATERHYHRT